MSQIKVDGKRKMNRRTKSHLIFYISMFILPLIQFFIFYVVLNFFAIQRAFTLYKIDYSTNVLKTSFAGFENFKLAFDLYRKNTYVWKTTFLSMGITLFISQPLGIIVSYYIFKKKPFSGFFKVMVFLPQVVSGLVFSLLFKYITENVYCYVMEAIFHKQVLGLLVNKSTQLGTVLFFNIWLGFGGNLLLISGAMNNIGDSMQEAAQIDGANMIQEFIYVVFPGIFGTYKQLLILSIAGIFSNQLSLMSLFGIHSDTTKRLATLGMFFYIKTYYAGNQIVDGVSYGVLTSFGLMATCVIVPLTLGLRKLMEKYGPRTD